MGAVDLVRDLMAEGVVMETDGQKIKWRDPSGRRMSADILAEIAAAKPEVIDFLATRKEAGRGDTITEPGTYGFTDRPMTWTGKIVSLDEWRRLSGWERDGSTGKIWNGVNHKWEAAR